ncbi:PASTA domain-containing protein [Microbacterium pumilum]|uniref:PASTA domain-containing protein n=1 Tax=Microbacterium pumilum TaxID=344165 RepID=A0ABN2SZD0_9MICO
MSDDDPRSIDEPSAGSDCDGVHPAGAGGEGRLGEPGGPGIEVGRDSPDPRGEPPAVDATAPRTSPAAGDVATKVRSKKGWIIGGSVAGAIVLVAGIAVIAAVAVTASSGSSLQAASSPSSSAPDSDLVEVPDLVGMTVAEARSELEAIGLDLVVADGTDDQAIVATQGRSEGQQVAVGADVLATVEWTAEPEMDSLSFADGAALDPLTMVGWSFSLGADNSSWISSPDAGEGEIIFVNDEGTCTAEYWQQTFDATATDDLAASDEYLAEVSGATADELAQYAFDGHFALSGGPDGPAREGEVATRTLLWSNDEGSFLLTARVFRNLDYATSTMSNVYTLEIQCDNGVDPEDVVESLDDIATVSVDE